MDNKPKYALLSGDIAVGASKLYLDLFNAAGSGHNIYIQGIYIRPVSDVAVSGVVSARHNILRTSAVGTGGTSVGYASTSETGATITPFDSQQPGLPSGITARIAPAGGATISARLATSTNFPEETNAAVTLSQHNNIIKGQEAIVVRAGEGILVKQGSVASVGSFEVEIHFTIEETE